MHQITGYVFHKNYVIYSTKYKHGRYCSMHDRTGLTDQQAQGKFIVEHNNEVNHLIQVKKQEESKKRIITLN